MSNFYNLAIDLASTIQKRDLNLQKKVMHIDLYIMKSEEMFHESTLNKKKKKLAHSKIEILSQSV